LSRNPSDPYAASTKKKSFVPLYISKARLNEKSEALIGEEIANILSLAKISKSVILSKLRIDTKSDPNFAIGYFDVSILKTLEVQSAIRQFSINMQHPWFTTLKSLPLGGENIPHFITFDLKNVTMEVDI
jgi:hypothetical protein